MQDGTSANRDEFLRAIEALTPGELLKLKHFAVWRMRGLGRAGCGRTWEDLLGEAKLATLKGATNNGGGRQWKRNVNLITHLAGAMHSISSHWKRDFDEREPNLESEILASADKSGPTSPLDKAVSDDPSQECVMAAREQLILVAARCHRDPAATQVLEGLSQGLTPSDIMLAHSLTRWEYQQATAKLRRLVRGIEQKGRLGL
jgi:hypothetical protein